MYVVLVLCCVVWGFVKVEEEEEWRVGLNNGCLK